MEIELIRQSVAAGWLRVTDHADEEMAADGLLLDDVLASLSVGEVIEDYPSDHPLPSCLIYGEANEGMPIHSVWAYNESTGRAVLVTVYRPDPNRWVSWRTRAK